VVGNVCFRNLNEVKVANILRHISTQKVTLFLKFSQIVASRHKCGNTITKTILLVIFKRISFQKARNFDKILYFHEIASRFGKFSLKINWWWETS
jgi:hypothetical protein